MSIFDARLLWLVFLCLVVCKCSFLIYSRNVADSFPASASPAPSESRRLWPSLRMMQRTLKCTPVAGPSWRWASQSSLATSHFYVPSSNTFSDSEETPKRQRTAISPTHYLVLGQVHSLARVEGSVQKWMLRALSALAKTRLEHRHKQIASEILSWVTGQFLFSETSLLLSRMRRTGIS